MKKAPPWVIPAITGTALVGSLAFATVALTKAVHRAEPPALTLAVAAPAEPAPLLSSPTSARTTDAPPTLPELPELPPLPTVPASTTGPTQATPPAPAATVTSQSAAQTVRVALPGTVIGVSAATLGADTAWKVRMRAENGSVVDGFVNATSGAIVNWTMVREAPRRVVTANTPAVPGDASVQRTPADAAGRDAHDEDDAYEEDDIYEDDDAYEDEGDDEDDEGEDDEDRGDHDDD